MTGRIVLLSAVVLAALVACGGKAPPPLAPPTPPPPTRVIATLEAAADLNPDITGEPKPLMLKIYELKTAAAFSAADFFALYDAPENALGADLLAQETMQIRPGESRILDRPVDPDTHHIGLVAAYRDLDHASWRAVITMVPNQTNRVRVSIGRLTLTVPGDEN